MTAAAMEPRVAILMGSDSDLPVVRHCIETLKEFGVPHEAHVMSAHRSPERTRAFALRAEERGLRVIICAAGGAAHLAGAVSAVTTLPVIGIPVASSPLAGVDALYATVQMPPGIPVATVAIGEGGAKNAAILATQILATSDLALREKLRAYKARLDKGVAEKDEKLQKSLEG